MPKSNSILSFTGAYRFLSNFEIVPVRWEGITYRSSEHAFHAGKTLNPKGRKLVKDCVKPGQAKAVGRKLPLRSDWEKVKAKIMHEVVYCKFDQNPDLLARLLDTDNVTLVEGNKHNDHYWGAIWLPADSSILPSEKVWATNSKGLMLAGRNQLGKILMKVREELK